MPLLILVVLSLYPPAVAQASPPPKGLAQPRNFEQFAVYWTAEAGWKTELLLRNNLPSQSLTVTPALRTADGTETALPAVTINSNDVATIDLGAVITNAAPQLAGAYGSIVFRYTAPVVRALYAAVMVELPGTPIEFHLDAFTQPSAWITGSREGIWWLPRDSVKDWLVLANTSASALSGNLTLYDASGKASTQGVTLNARQMTRVSVRSLLQQAGLTGSFGGIKIDVPNGAGYLDSAHFVYDDASGFLALMKMFDRDPNATLAQRSLTDKQWTLRAPMLALTNPDPALALPAGTTLQPAIFLRNASASAYTAQVTFNWRSGTTTGKSTTAVPLQAYATNMLDVAALQAQGTIPASAQWAYVSITAPIQPDNLLAVAASYDATGKLGAQTPFSDQVANHWEGGKWEVGANHDTIIAVGNAGTTASKAQITFYYNSGQGKYQVEQTLGPDEQVWMDMGKVIGTQIPDKNGSTIPAAIMSGTYDLKSLSNKPTEGLFEGKLVVDKTYGYAAHGCMVCCGWGGPYMYYDPFNLAVGGSGYQDVWATDSCAGYDDSVVWFYSSWWTGNTQIATANVNQISAAGAGSTTNSAYSSGIPVGDDAEHRSCPPDRAYTTSGTVNVAPHIDSISPGEGLIGTTVSSVTIDGSGFTSPTINVPAGITASIQGYTSTRIVANFSIAGNASSGNNQVSVTANGMTSNAVNFTVQVPDHLVVVDDTSGPYTPCPAFIQRLHSYTMMAGDIVLASTAIGEVGTIGTNSCAGESNAAFPTGCPDTTDINGLFQDRWTVGPVGTCITPSPSNCGYSITDHWQACLASGNRTAGTLTGYIHADAISINGVVTPNRLPTGLSIPP